MRLSVSSPLIRLNPWDASELRDMYAHLSFIASNSAQSVGRTALYSAVQYHRFIASNSAQSVGRKRDSPP